MAKHETTLVIPEGKARDYVDGTIRNDTPEEYVRKTVEKRLVNEHKYVKERIAVEYLVQIGSGKKSESIYYTQRIKVSDHDKQEKNFAWYQENTETYAAHFKLIFNSTLDYKPY